MVRNLHTRSLVDVGARVWYSTSGWHTVRSAHTLGRLEQPSSTGLDEQHVAYWCDVNKT